MSSSRAAIQRLLRAGFVRVNGRVVKPGLRLRQNDQIAIELPERPGKDDSLIPWTFSVDILYEDESILAINKPSHVVTHPGAGQNRHTIVNALIHVRPEMRNIGHPLRPGIVHRLDKETSGLLLLAKTEPAYHALVGAFKERQIEKRYRAFAFGKFESKQRTIDRAIGRDPMDRKKISVRARRKRHAITIYRVMRQYEFAALLDVQILTGRTHQIRVHLATENHPVVGDGKYGGGNWNRIGDSTLRTTLRQGAFFGLHSFSLDFDHPVSGARLHLEAPLPEIWKEIL